MFGLFKTKQVPSAPTNIYDVLSEELVRLHKQLNATNNESNVRTLWSRISEIHAALLTTLEKQPTSDAQLKDLQNAVADILLLGGK